MIRLGLMLERSRGDECAVNERVDARRARRLEDSAIWYVGVPFLPRRAVRAAQVDTSAPARSELVLPG